MLLHIFQHHLSKVVAIQQRVEMLQVALYDENEIGAERISH